MTLWLCFGLIIVACFALDLGIVHRRDSVVSLRQAMGMTTFWIALALTFNILIYFTRGSSDALAFFTGYLVEKALSIDNIFIIIVIFGYFKIPDKEKYRLLFWGILGALFFRLVLIYAGLQLLATFAWIPYVLGGFLMWSGYKLFRDQEFSFNPEEHRLIHVLQRYFHLSKAMTALVVIEVTDLIFALDSIPAIFAITEDPFLVYTSNVFAVLGLRSMHFVLSHFTRTVKGLKSGLAAVLIFIGLKFVISPWVKIPTGITLAVIVVLFASSLAAKRLLRR